MISNSLFGFFMKQNKALKIEDFVGRHSELVRLETCLDKAAGGNGQVVMVSGEPGVGKTFLVNKFMETPAAKAAQVYSGRCHELQGTPPLLAVGSDASLLCARK